MVSSGNSNKFKLKSKYFNYHATGKEQGLVNSLIKEAIHINGLNMLYIPRQYVNLDKIYGEDVLSSFSKTYEMVFYVESSESYAGNNSFFGNMGFDIQDQSTLILSRDVFKDVIVDSPTNTEGFSVDQGPRRGDLLYWPETGRIFEITNNENYKMFYQLGKLFTYKLTVEFFDYSHEKLDTNLPEIDKKFDNEIVKKYEIKLDTAPGTPYTVGEQVYTGASIVTAEFVGTVESYSPEIRTIVVASAYGVPEVGESLIGEDSEAAADMLSFVIQNSTNPTTTQSDNEPLAEEVVEMNAVLKDPEDDY